MKCLSACELHVRSRGFEWLMAALGPGLMVLMIMNLVSGTLVGAVQANTESERALLDAARGGDIERVEALLDEGVDVNTGDRYGSTALFFAADKGYLEMARLLVERGARLDISDRFYQMTPMVRALSSEHFDVAQFLVEKGSPGAGMVVIGQLRRLAQGLPEADSSRAIRLILASLDNGKIDAAQLSEAKRRAADGGPALASVRRRLDEVRPMTADARSDDAVNEQRLRAIVGTYQNDAREQSLTVHREQGNLSLEGLASGAPRRLSSVGGSLFDIEGEDAKVWFGGRGGMIERMEVRRGDDVVSYRPIDEAESRESAPDSAGDVVRAISRNAVHPREPAKPWAGFRGDSALGIADGQGIPSAWNVAEQRGVLWKVPIDGFSVSSPIIWGDRVVVLTAVSQAGDDTFRIGLYGDTRPVDDLSKHVWKMTSIHRETGAVQWETVLYEEVPKTKRHTKSSQANSTPVTDGTHIVSVLGSIGKMICLDMEGNLVWERDIGVLNSAWFYDPDYQWGYSSSPILYQGMVILQADVHDGSFIAAFDVASGEERWRTIREDEISTFSTPSVWRAPSGSSLSDELVTNGTTIRAYDPANGKPLWFLGPNSEIPIGAPLVTDELIYVIAGYPPIRPIYAVRPGHRGDLSLDRGKANSEALAWSKNRGGTYIPTALVYGGYLYTNANNGRLTCYDAKTGERIYRQRIGGVGGSYAASPIAADGRLYFTNEEGETFVVRAGPNYELLSKNTVDEVVMSTPAASNGVLVIRGLKHVFGLGEGSEE